MKKITFLFLILSFISCKKEPLPIAFDNSIIKDTVLNIIIRPVHPDLLSNKSDSIKLYYQKMNFHEIWYLASEAGAQQAIMPRNRKFRKQDGRRRHVRFLCIVE